MIVVPGDPCLIDMGIFNRYAGRILLLLAKDIYLADMVSPYETASFIQQFT